MKRSHILGLPLVTLAVCSGNAFGESLNPNGSRICDSSRVALAAIDANFTLVSNSDKIIYCAAAQDDDCRPDGGQSFRLRYRILGGSFADLPTSNGSGPFLASSGTSLSNNNSVSSSERRCNTSGSGSYQTGKEFTTSTSLSYASDWRDDRTEGQWALDFSTSPDSTTYEFQVRWSTSDCGTKYITYPAQITTTSSGPPPQSHHWDFYETSGATADDSIGTSDSTLTNFPGDNSQWSCLDGGSLLFDGVDDYVSLPTESDYDFTEFVSIAAWIKVTSFSVADQAIVTKGDNAYRARARRKHRHAQVHRGRADHQHRGAGERFGQ